MAEILVEEISSGTTLIDTLIAQAKGRSAKPKKEEDEDFDDEEVAPKKVQKEKRPMRMKMMMTTMMWMQKKKMTIGILISKNLICQSQEREKGRTKKKTKILK